MSLNITHDNVCGDLPETLSPLVEGRQGAQPLLHQFYSALTRGRHTQ
jgi:hypothetical protein